MKVSRAQAEENRNRIVEVAAEMFRERGFDGIGVADLMKAAGLTHGGFYGHFKSRRILPGKPARAPCRKSRDKLAAVAEAGSDDHAGRCDRRTCPDRHRQGRAGRVVPLPRWVRMPPGTAKPLRSVFSRRASENYLEVLTDIVPGRTKPRASQERLWRLCLAMVGALVPARAVDDVESRKELLAATAAEVLLRHQPATPDRYLSLSRSAIAICG